MQFEKYVTKRKKLEWKLGDVMKSSYNEYGQIDDKYIYHTIYIGKMMKKKWHNIKWEISSEEKKQEMSKNQRNHEDDTDYSFTMKSLCKKS